MAYQYDEFGRPVLGGQYLADVGRGVVQDNRVAGFTPGANTVLARNDQGGLVTNSMRIGGGSAARGQPVQQTPIYNNGNYSNGPNGNQSWGPVVGTNQRPASQGAGQPWGPAVGTNQGSPSLNSYQQNPYLSQMADVMRGQMTQNLERNVLPGIRSNAIAAGGFGGSRQGVVEANALNDANRTLNDSITGMNFQDFTNQMNRNLQRYGMDQNYTLGQGQLALGNQNSMQNFYNANRGMDLQQTQLGANLFNMGNQGFLSQGQGLYGLGGQQQQAPWNIVNNANAGLGQWSGYGTTTSANQGGGAQGFLGGALAGGQLGSLWGNTGTSGVTAPVGGYTSGANYNFAPQGGLGLRWP